MELIYNKFFVLKEKNTFFFAIPWQKNGNKESILYSQELELTQP